MHDVNEIIPAKRPKWLIGLYAIISGIIILFSTIYLIIQLNLPDVKDLINTNPRATALMQQRQDETQSTGKKLRIRQYWVRFSQIPDLLKKTVRISEDANFYFHNGVDLDELEESIKKNFEKGEFSRGGSTITQQLAKNLYLSTDKSIFRKIEEFFIAKELEANLSKNRIFHIYLNIIEFGRGIFGVEAAARYYFNKPVDSLTKEEIIRLTAIIPRPLSVRANGNSKWLFWRCRWITDKLLLYKYIDPAGHEQLSLSFNPE